MFTTYNIPLLIRSILVRSFNIYLFRINKNVLTPLVKVTTSELKFHKISLAKFLILRDSCIYLE